MKKILFFTNGLYGGGAEKVLQTLLQHIDKSKFEITLYSLKQEKLNNLYPEDIIYRYIFSSYNSHSHRSPDPSSSPASSPSYKSSSL